MKNKYGFNSKWNMNQYVKFFMINFVYYPELRKYKSLSCRKT